MSDSSWGRHANPWSVYSRLATVPFIVLAFHSRNFIGGWFIGLLALLAYWLYLNVRIFAPPETARHWVTQGIYGEFLWLNGAIDPARSRLPSMVSFAFSAAGLVGTAIALYNRFVVAALVASLLIIVGQLVRLAWLAREYRRFAMEHPRHPLLARLSIAA